MSKVPAKQTPRVNVRRKSVMEQIQGQISEFYASPFVDELKETSEGITQGNTTIYLAQKSGFCYGVRRAIDLAHATCEVFPERRKFLIGEMIHNSDVNQNLRSMGILHLPWQQMNEQYEELTDQDVVIVPAFGVPTSFMEKLKEKQVTVIDTTCGDVIRVWKRVQKNAQNKITSIIHGKVTHEETRATISRAVGDDGLGHYLVILNQTEADILAQYITEGGDKTAFLKRFTGSFSQGFNPDVHLAEIGMANQTTMYRKDTELVQSILHKAIMDRDSNNENFHVYDTICNATQIRQDSLSVLIDKDLDVLFVVGGFNSANTTHLVEVGLRHLPTFFIKDADAIESFTQITNFDIEQKTVGVSRFNPLANKAVPVKVGITAGASCPNSLIEETVRKVLDLRK